MIEDESIIIQGEIVDIKQITTKIEENLSEFIQYETPEAKQLWEEFLQFHPADMADFLAALSHSNLEQIFPRLPAQLRLEVFGHMSESLKVFILSFLDEEKRSLILAHTPLDELTDLFEFLSDQDLKKYLQFLSNKDRKKVLSLMKFDPESAGGIMDTDVVTLLHNFTVSKSIHVLQRLQPRKELHHNIYVTDQDNKLVGYITLDDLVLKRPDVRLLDFIRKPELIVDVNEDREDIAKKMRHYEVMSAPVVDKEGLFLGVIPSDTLIDIIEEETSEDVYHMSAMPAIKYPYFETSFYKMLIERSFILFVLLIMQSLSTMIIKYYKVTLQGFLIYFITMLVSTGGNSSNQTSAVVIQGMASGQITSDNIHRFLRREIVMAIMMACILGVVAFLRAYFTEGSFFLGNVAISFSLSLIVLVSVILGSSMPLILQKLGLDPAFAAGPFLATLMDVLGLLIYCYISKLLLG